MVRTLLSHGDSCEIPHYLEDNELGVRLARWRLFVAQRALSGTEPPQRVLSRIWKMNANSGYLALYELRFRLKVSEEFLNSQGDNRRRAEQRVEADAKARASQTEAPWISV